MQTDKFSGLAWESRAFVAVAVGWSAYDLALVATSGAPYLLAKFLPLYGLVLLVAALTGLCCAFDPRIFWGLLVLTAAAALAPRLYKPELAWNLICLPRAVLLLLVAAAIGRRLGRRGRPAFWPGVGLGVIGAVVFAMYLGSFSALSSRALTAGLVLVASSALRQPLLRRTATAATGILFSTVVLALGLHHAALRRPDVRGTKAPTGSERRPNLVLIVLDTVSAHHLALYGYSRVTTPGLDAFVRKNAIQFTQARSVSSWTLPSHASIFTGLYPSEHGATHPRHGPRDGTPRRSLPNGGSGRWPAQPLRGDVTTLAERLLAEGYQTGRHRRERRLFGARVRCRPWLRALRRSLRGRNCPPSCSCRRRDSTSRSDERRRGGARESRTSRSTGSMPPSRRQPFFLFLNYMDAHDPYLPPSRMTKPLVKNDLLIPSTTTAPSILFSTTASCGTSTHKSPVSCDRWRIARC